MIFIFLSILASIGLFLIFRMFSTYNVKTRQAIMLNYLVASFFGFSLYPPSEAMFISIWFGPSLILGVLFYLIFQLMALVTQNNGMSISSISTKMSVIFPVAAGVLILDETSSFIKFFAIALGLLAIAFSAGGTLKGGDLKWPILLFIGSGAIDTSLKLFQHFWVSNAAFPQFSATIFLGAFVSAVVHHVISDGSIPDKRTAIGGVVLGIVNFAALFAILEALSLPNLESSVVFPLNNVGIIAGSTLLAVFALNEKLSPKGWLGFIMASASIGMLYFVT